jgi:hypothetical protein
MSGRGRTKSKRNWVGWESIAHYRVEYSPLGEMGEMAAGEEAPGTVLVIEENYGQA